MLGFKLIMLVKWSSFTTAKGNSRAHSRLVPSQWETSLQSNAVSHWLGANLESALNSRGSQLTKRPPTQDTHHRRYIAYHQDDVIMSTIASQITSLTIFYSTIYSGADQSKHQSSASLAFVWGIHRGPVNSPHKWPVTRKMFPFYDVIMCGRKWTQVRRW